MAAEMLPMVATAVLLLLQVPPDTALLSVLVVPWHITSAPVMPDGAALIVTVVVCVQPLPSA